MSIAAINPGPVAVGVIVVPPLSGWTVEHAVLREIEAVRSLDIGPEFSAHSQRYRALKEILRVTGSQIARLN